ncbi:MAG: DUF2325 domain-containing protein [Bacillota bacterium]|nr:DUF2325 domain-containing protein [Bacillota bacterium]
MGGGGVTAGEAGAAGEGEGGRKPAARGALPRRDLCELDALSGWLANMDAPDLRELVRSSPKRFGQKALRSSPQRLLDRAISALGHESFRRHVEADVRARAGGAIRRLASDPAGAARELESMGVPGTAILGFAWLLGLGDAEARKAWRALSRAARAEARDREERDLAAMARLVERAREGREKWAEESAERSAARLAERMAAPWRWEAERAARKLETGTAKLTGEVARLKRELAEARERIRELEEERDDLRAAVAHLADALRQERARAAAPRGTDPGAGTSKAKPLKGERVVVIGDDARAPEYRTIVEEMGGEFDFQPGFDRLGALPARLEWATLCVLITAYASHKAWGHVRAAEARGLRVILVDRAGADAFRRALESASMNKVTKGGDVR